jgi:TolB-like protein/class 3 adenylate cyclase/Tfp pilus assembly protein PilF
MPTQLKSDLHLEIAHVLFIDVVGYSKLLVNEQREVVQQLNQVVRKTPQFRKSEVAGKLIRIPVGDGMALVFFQTPEEPVQCAMEIAKALKAHPRIRLRMGVHSGPVDQVKDVNDRSNVAGAGINIAQRVMSCGDAGHILLSKRVAEDLAHDRHWHPHLHELGEVELKHGHRVEIVNVYTEELGNPELPGKLAHFQRVSKPESASAPLVNRATSSVPEKSIAVLPFENLSADPENAFFAIGVQDEILTNLAKIADLKVISRTSVMQYKADVKRNLREIANALGVANVVEGTVQRTGNRVRVSAQLIDARSDMHLWGENYHRPIDDVFAIQSEIAKTVADQLQAKLSPNEKAAIEQPATADLVAFNFYTRAKILRLVTFSALSINYSLQAIELLSQAVARDPTFFLAYCQLAVAHDQLYFFGYDHTSARLALANEALNTALRLGPDRGEAHLSAAWIYYQCYRDYDRAQADLEMARRTLPNNAEVFELTGYIDRRQGRWDESTRNLERAIELDPRNFFTLQQISDSYRMLRRYAEMTAVLNRALAIAPKDVDTKVARASIDLDWHANLRPLRATIEAILAEDSAAAPTLADAWLDLALCEHDPVEATRALASIPVEGVTPKNVRIPRSFYEGLAARTRGDAAAAHSAFTAARAETQEVVREQPDYAEALCMLGMIDAGLGRKEDALREGRRAVELLPVSKDAKTGSELILDLAIIYAWTGEKELALEQLAAALELPCAISYGQLRLHPYWDPLRDEPRFEELVAEAQKPVALK